MLEFLKNKEEKKQFYFSYVIFLINGMLALSIGALMPFIRDARGLNYAFCGLLVSLHSLGNLFSSFAAGALPAWLGRKKSILIFNSAFPLAYLLMLGGGGEWSLILAFFMTGLARGATSNFCNHMINNLSPGKAWIINGLHGMFSVGAFLFPLLLTAVTYNEAGNFLYVCWGMVIMGALSFSLYALIPTEDGPVKKKTSGKPQLGFLKEPIFYLCVATLFFYLCAEQGVIGWLVTYFKDAGLLSGALAQVMSSVLWIMILAGRLSTAWLSTRIKKEKLLLMMGIGLVLFFIVLITARSGGMIVIGIMGFGFSMSGIYPTTVSFAGHIIKRYAMAWSVMLTTASVGAIVMPSLIGRIAEAAGIFYGMSSVAAAVVVDLGFIIALKVYIDRQQKQA